MRALLLVLLLVPAASALPPAPGASARYAVATSGGALACAGGTYADGANGCLVEIPGAATVRLAVTDDAVGAVGFRWRPACLGDSTFAYRHADGAIEMPGGCGRFQVIPDAPALEGVIALSAA